MRQELVETPIGAIPCGVWASTNTRRAVIHVHVLSMDTSSLSPSPDAIMSMSHRVMVGVTQVSVLLNAGAPTPEMN